MNLYWISKTTNRQCFSKFLVLGLLFFVLFTLNQSTFASHILNQIKVLNYDNVDTAYQQLGLKISRGIVNGDTLTYLKAIHIQSKIAKYKGFYNEAYELNWLLLGQCDSVKYPEIIAGAYLDLGYMYVTYRQYHLSKEYHQKSLAINKELVKKGILEESELTHNYYAIATYYKKIEDYKQALHYLSKCSEINTKYGLINANSGFINGETGDCYLQMDDYKSAKKYLLESLSFFENQNVKEPMYCYVNLYLGNLYFELNQYKLAEKFFLNTISIADTMQIGSFLKQTALAKLAKISVKNENYKNAYQYLNQEKILGDSLFGILNSHNSELFQIRNSYREESEKLNMQMKEKELTVLRQKQSLYLSHIKLIVLAVSSLILILLLFIYFQKKRSRQVIHQKNDILEIKKKELTSSSLKTIETNELILQLKKDIDNYKGHEIPKSDLRSFTHGLTISTKNYWAEFDLRFTSVNEQFYKKLLKMFPNLSANELKLCAMLKLGLSGNEMSKLMGISLKSVHTARYRMRKKMQLRGDVDLQHFVSKI